MDVDSLFRMLPEYRFLPPDWTYWGGSSTNTSYRIDNMVGRGAWNSAGVGGTLSIDGRKPGMYYRLPATGTNYIGKTVDPADPNQRAVKGAVKAYQGALNRRLGTKLVVDGILGPTTSAEIVTFQKSRGLVSDGVIGPSTSRALLLYDLALVIRAGWAKYPGTGAVTQTVVCGLITQESGWDAGAVGYVDDKDLGLCQINGPSHPEYSEEQRLDPVVAFEFAAQYLRTSLADDKIETIDDAIASYNLGVGGARKWIAAGRPNPWKPTATSAPRDVLAYIHNIKTACAK